ncbi:MAG: hypothetical protein E7192_04250 [Erysipelotrichaceae bacterium]|nr:hypothetical protein [Erysipelotrichaceae bacterium]
MEVNQNAMKAALQLYQEKPWDLFDSTEVFEIGGYDAYGKAFCFFHEKHGKKCITVFEGPEAFTDLSNHFKPLGIQRVDVFHYLQRECFEILFDVPEFLEQQEKQTGELLGLTLREIPAIRYFERFCTSDIANEMELQRLVLILEGLKEAMLAYLKSGMNLDFSKRRFVYHVKKKTCSSKRSGYRPKKYDVVEIDDPLLMDELKESQRTEEVWEIDLQPTSMSLTSEHTGRLQPVMMTAISSPLTDQILAAVPIASNNDMQFQCIDLVIEALMQRGLPQALMVRHPLVGSALMDLCMKLNIQLIPVEHFEMLDEFYDGMMNYFEGMNEKIC